MIALTAAVFASVVAAGLAAPARAEVSGVSVTIGDTSLVVTGLESDPATCGLVIVEVADQPSGAIYREWKYSGDSHWSVTFWGLQPGTTYAVRVEDNYCTPYAVPDPAFRQLYTWTGSTPTGTTTGGTPTGTTTGGTPTGTTTGGTPTGTTTGGTPTGTTTDGTPTGTTTGGTPTGTTGNAASTEIAVPRPADRFGYCSVAGNTQPDGAPIAAGTFLNLVLGQPGFDPHYTGAYPSFYIEGVGITCNPPAGLASLQGPPLRADAGGNQTPDGFYVYVRSV
jgi:hypothetical protein